MRAQGFDKIANKDDPRYIEYNNVLKILKAMQILVEESKVMEDSP